MYPFIQLLNRQIFTWFQKLFLRHWRYSYKEIRLKFQCSQSFHSNKERLEKNSLESTPYDSKCNVEKNTAGKDRFITLTIIARNDCPLGDNAKAVGPQKHSPKCKVPIRHLPR